MVMSCCVPIGQGPGAAPPKRATGAKEETREAWSPHLLASFGAQEVGLGLVRTALDILNRCLPASRPALIVACLAKAVWLGMCESAVSLKISQPPVICGGD